MSAASKRDLLIVSCAVSAGVHAALIPEHLEESARAGGGFVAATVLLGLLAIAFTAYPVNRLGLNLAVLTFAGLLVAYGLAVTSGVPILMPDPEPIDGLALATKAVEIVGLVTAWSLLHLYRTNDAPLTRHEGVSV